MSLENRNQVLDRTLIDIVKRLFGIRCNVRSENHVFHSQKGVIRRSLDFRKGANVFESVQSRTGDYPLMQRRKHGLFLDDTTSCGIDQIG